MPTTIELEAREFCQGKPIELYGRAGIYQIIADFHRQQRIVELKELRGKVEKEKADDIRAVGWNGGIDVALKIIDAEIGDTDEA